VGLNDGQFMESAWMSLMKIGWELRLFGEVNVEVDYKL
jgi:hypothetical protein